MLMGDVPLHSGLAMADEGVHCDIAVAARDT